MITTRTNVDAFTLWTLQQRAEKLNKKAAKLGIPSVEIQITSEVITKDEHGWEHPAFNLEMTLPDQPVCKNGYEMVAIASAVNDGESVSSAPRVIRKVLREGDFDLSPFYADKLECAHCHTNRFRNSMAILWHLDSGSLIAVGMDCLEYYIPTPLNQLEWIMDVYYNTSREGSEEDWDGFSRADVQPRFTLKYAVQVACSWLDHEQYFNSNHPEFPSRTRHEISHLLNLMSSSSRFWSQSDREMIARFKSNPKSLDSYETETLEIIAHVKGFRGYTDYEQNMLNIFNAEYLSFRNLGFIVSAVPVYRKLQTQKRTAASEGSKFYGTPGDKFNNVKVFLKDVVPTETRYGVSYRVIMTTEDGILFVWWASSDPDKTKGSTYILSGSIKDHTDWRGTKQTVVTRCKLT
jgi:hypothetical protein